MNTLRVIEQGVRPAASVSADPAKVAVEVVADWGWNGRGKGLTEEITWVAGEPDLVTEEMLAALEAAAPYALMTASELDRQVRGVGNCAGQDPEVWFPAYDEDPARRASLPRERAEVDRLCAGCPVKGQCLAFDLVQVEGRVQNIWGVHGGVGARDRRVLLKLWLELVNRLQGTQRVISEPVTTAVA